MKRLIREQWEAFRLLVMPADAPPDQIREMRRAFYVGARESFAQQIQDGVA